ncbi:hypothetical protein [Aquimarina algicola]|uniref:Uncharacterized protein n=1 Tax=Aquimarina algicola TaxID=2589995 RepID=A0A504J2R9_9FLAO|nr:hypothetical protein [Aquimarina algicola]TPN85157.1 hypothetical protein FHK87_14090 [Aquimarina algicola]
MDELELLKQDWKKQEEALPKLTYTDIYKMKLKKSSSLVRWIFVISILEFFLWASLDTIFKFSGMQTEFESKNLENVFTGISIFSYLILLYFIIRFYMNYKKIRSTDSTKVLMKNIIRTRRTVKQYIWVNISQICITMFAATIYIYFFTDEFSNGTTAQAAPVWLFIVVTVLIISVFAGFFALFYRVIYGILTRRLKENYKELEHLEEV